MSQDFYKVLGLDKNATPDQIKKSYRKLAKEYHPDINKSPGAEEKFKKINEAYEVLGDPEKKANYDRFGSAAFEGTGSGFEGGVNPFDIFSNFFSREDEGTFFTNFGSTGGTRRSKSRSSTSRKDITITFLQSIKGCEYELSYKSNQVCKECKGTRAYMGDKSYIYNCSICKGYGYEIIRTKTLFGIHEEQTVCRYCGGTGEKITKECTACKRQGYVSEAKKVTIKIPGGVQNGAVLLFRDTQSFDEQKIQLCIHVSSSEIFTREGDNLKTTIYVNPLTLILGGTIEVPTPYGLKKVTLAPGSTTKEFKLKGMGITHNKKGIGDLFVKPEIGSLKLSSLELEKIKSIKLSELKETKDWLKQFKKEYGA